MTAWICVTCGTQYPDSDEPPAHCPICEDERQYIGPNGQQWTDMARLGDDHHNVVKTLEPGLTGIGTYPSFAIGQRALLVQTDDGNLLWDCISLLDDPTIAAIKALGGIDAIAISHPHYYSAMIDWAHAFDAPIHIHTCERKWVERPDDAVQFWDGEERDLFGGLRLLRLGGHYGGGQVLHWPAGAEGRGALLSGDIVTVVADKRYVSFMYSYPNLIPLPAALVERIAAKLEPVSFDRIYGAWWDRVIDRDGHAAVQRSAERYIRALNGEVGSLPNQLRAAAASAAAASSGSRRPGR